jgi:hypothetical protein
MIDNLAQPTACNLIFLVGGSFQMEVGRGLVYPRQTMLNDIQIDTSSYVVVKVDMVHDNLKDLKLEVALDNTTLTIRDAVTRRVYWRWTSIDIDPSTAASASTTPSQPNTSPTSMSPEARLSPIQDQPHLSPIPEQLCSSQFDISRRSLQLKSSRVGLHLRLRVSHSLRLIRCRQR